MKNIKFLKNKTMENFDLNATKVEDIDNYDDLTNYLLTLDRPVRYEYLLKELYNYGVKFDTDTTKIKSEKFFLGKIFDEYREKNELTKYVLSLNNIDAYEFILKILDAYNMLEGELRTILEKFLAQKSFNKYRNKIMLWLDDTDENVVSLINGKKNNEKDDLEVGIASQRILVDEYKNGSSFYEGELQVLKELESKYSLLLESETI